MSNVIESIEQIFGVWTVEFLILDFESHSIFYIKARSDVQSLWYNASFLSSFEVHYTTNAKYIL